MIDNKKSILVTGSTGFLGSHVVRSLTQEGFYHVICLKRSFSNMNRLSNINLENVTFYNIDLVDVERVFQENKIDLILHMATEYGRKGKTCYEVLETNLMFPIKVAELGVKYHAKCFINTDSFFNKETYTYNALLNYSLSKKSLLSWLKVFSNDISVVNVILEHIYGEYDNDSKFVEFIIQCVGIEQKAEVDLSHGHQRRDFIYIADVVSAFNAIIKSALSDHFHYKVFEVGCGKAIEVRQFVDKVKELSNSITRLNYGKIPYRSDEIMESKANTQELQNLGWQPQFTIESGIQRIIDAYR